MIGVGKRWGIGRDKSLQNAFTGDMSPDNIFRTLHRLIVSEAEKFGPILSPKGNRKLSSAINEVAPGEHIYLASGTYHIGNFITIDKSVKITGIGRVVIVSAGEAFNITGSDVCIKNLEFVQRPDPASVSAVSSIVLLRGNRCRVEDCLFNEKQAYGISGTGDQAAIVGCRFTGHASHTAANSDIYFYDSASEGIVAGVTRSQTRSYTLSYKTGTDMSESANGPSSVIEVRP